MKLREIPPNSKIYDKEISDGSTYLTFFHLDGLYSYCETEKGNTIHLSGNIPLKKIGNHYEIDELKNRD